jgi:hypothetical protein
MAVDLAPRATHALLMLNPGLREQTAHFLKTGAFPSAPGQAEALKGLIGQD